MAPLYYGAANNRCAPAVRAPYVCNAECCAGIFASIVHLPSNCIISICPLACFYTMQEALMVCHRTLQARAVRPPQRRWSRLPPDAGSELAAGGARAAKRMRLRRCSAVAVRPPLTVASWSTRGAVSVRANPATSAPSHIRETWRNVAQTCLIIKEMGPERSRINVSDPI